MAISLFLYISSAVNSTKESYIWNYPNENSKSDVTDFVLPDGRVRIWCTDYSKEREEDEEINWTDHLSVAASSVEFTDFLQSTIYLKIHLHKNWYICKN